MSLYIQCESTGHRTDLALDEAEGLVCDCIMLLNTARSFKPMVCSFLEFSI